MSAFYSLRRRGSSLLSFLLAALLPFASAQLSSKGELEVASDLTLTSRAEQLSDGFGLTLRGHLELDYRLSPAEFRAVLDPTLRLPSSDPVTAFVEPGLTEAFALYRLGQTDVSAGLERLPLEYARLSVPFRVEPTGKTGAPQGLLGVRASVFAGDWRVRPALVYRYQDEEIGGVLSVRRDFTSFELEAHALYLERLALGLGGSGLLGDLVLYGEAWLLGSPWEGRGALGLSGFWGDALWTAEAAYAPLPSGATAEAFPQVTAQLSLPQGDSGSWELGAGLGLTESLLGGSSTLQGLASASYTYSAADYSLQTSLSLAHTEVATLYGLRLGLTTFF